MENQVHRTKIFIFYAVTTLYWFSMYTYVPILAPYVEHLGGSLSMAGLVVGAYGITQMVVRIPIGFASDRLGRRKPFVTMGIVLAALSSLGLGLARSATAALVFRGIAGVAAGAWVAFSVLFSGYFPERQGAASMGLILFFMTIGQTLGSTLGGILMDFFGWGAPFFVGAVAGFAGLGLNVAVVEGHNLTAQPMGLGDLRRVGSEKMLLKASSLAVVTQALSFASVYGFSPTFAVELGATGTDLSILALVSALPAALISLRTGQLTARFGERRVLTAAMVLFAAAVVAVPFSPNLGVLFLTQGLGAVGRGATVPILMGLSIQGVALENRATAMGFFQSIYALGMTFGPAIMGVLGDAVGLNLGFVIMGLCGLAAASLAWNWIPDPVHKSQD